MLLAEWQQRFENWLNTHHAQEDAAHDISHFRRVWSTAQQLVGESGADELVILTACYFHDIVSLAKNHPQRHHSSRMAAQKTRSILQSASPTFQTTVILLLCMPLKRIALVRLYCHKA